MWFSRCTTQWHHALLLLCIMVLGRAPVASSLSKASIPSIYSALLADSSASCNDSSASENAYSLLLHDNLPASSNETVDNDNDSVPSNEKEAGSKYEAAVQRVRTRVRMRDTDIVLVTFPKSGTHFLAAAVTALLDNTTGAYVRAKTAEAARLGKIPPLAANSFHGFPVFTMMPDDRGIPVPEDTLEFVESFPEDVPRIFMTHEPVPDLELALSEGTRVINLIRDPRAVCASLFRTFRTMRMESWATHRPEDVPEVFLEPIAADFVGLGNSKSGIHFPARAVDDRENPFPYTWSAHVGGWYDFGKKRPADTYRILDFDDDVRSSKKAAGNTVRKLADFLLGKGAVSEDDVADIVDKTSVAYLRRVMQDSDMHHHFHTSSDAGWKEDFASLPAAVENVFNKLALAPYEVLMRRRKMALWTQERSKKTNKEVAPDRRMWL